MTPVLKKLLNVSEVAALLGVSDGVIVRWLQSGELTGLLTPAGWRLETDTLDAWVKKYRQPGKSKDRVQVSISKFTKDPVIMQLVLTAINDGLLSMDDLDIGNINKCVRWYRVADGSIRLVGSGVWVSGGTRFLLDQDSDGFWCQPSSEVISVQPAVADPEEPSTLSPEHPDEQL